MAYTEDDVFELFSVALYDDDAEPVRVALQVSNALAVRPSDVCTRVLTSKGAKHRDHVSTALAVLGRYGAVDDVLGLLTSANYVVRENVVRALGQLGGADVYDALVRAQEDADFYVRAWAKRAASAGPQEPVVESLGELDARARTIADLLLARHAELDLSIVATLLDSRSQALRTRAHAVLSEGSNEVRSAFFSMLEQRRGLPTRELITLIGALGDERGIGYLLRAIPVAPPDLRDACISTLPQLESSTTPAVIATLVAYLERNEESKAALAALLGMGEAAVAQVLEAYASSRYFRRHHAGLLATVAGAQAVRPLVDALADPYREVRESAAAALRSALGFDTADLVELLQRTPDVALRRLALGLLGYMGRPETFDLVASFIADAEMAAAAVGALAGFPTDRSLELIEAVLREGNSLLRRPAFEALAELSHARIRPPQWRPLLDRLLQHPVLAVRVAAFDVLSRALGTAAMREDAVARSMVEALGAEDPLVADRASKALVSLGEVARAALAAAKHPRGDKALRIQQTLARIIDQPERDEPNLWQFSARGGGGSPAQVGPQQMQQQRQLPVPIRDHVKLSVSAPALLAPGDSFVLGVWVHRDELRRIALEAAEQLRGREPRLDTRGPVAVERGATLEVELVIPDFGIESLEDAIFWSGELGAPVGNCTFPVKVPDDIELGVHLGQVRFRLGPLAIAKLDFAIDVGDRSELRTADVTLREERLSTAFASYASEDRDDVLGRIQGMLKVLPELDIFLDVLSLRSGDRWEERLKSEISSRDAFFLFWSTAAKKSDWVDREWRIALRSKGLDFISPVPLVSRDIAPPPEELAALHFNDWTLAFQKGLAASQGS